MTTKRPWSPGPWHAADFMQLFMKAENVKLACAAPEMAELLIRLIKESTCIDINTFHDLLLDAVKLLREAGYEYEPDQT